MSTIEELLKHACEVATATGHLALNAGPRRREVNQSLKHDIKLVMDRECQDLAEEMVSQRYPDHRILGEEGTIERDSEITWVIDPIDGTMNYFHGFPHWCCSVAVMKDEDILAGAVYLPEKDELYAAGKGLPATCNGETIQVSDCPALDSAMVLVGLGKPLADESYNVVPYGYLAKAAQKTRVMGAAAVDLCFVASGKAEAYCDYGIQLWDYAAAELIVKQAGGRFDIIEKHPQRGTRIVASNGRLHDEVKAVYTA